MWRRTLLENADGVDNTCLVLWIQTDQHHVDIRIPSSRPVFSPVSQLSDYTLDQLKCLADQEGFTGITQVEANIAEWVREQDYQTFNYRRDIAEMRFENDSTLIEIGVEDSYSECWEKLANSNKNLGMKKTLGKDRHAKKVPARLFTANNIFAYVRPRTAKLPDAKSLAAAIDTYHPSKETLLDWLDFEISFGQIKDKNQGYIMHSTLPFREGTFFDFNMFV
jgi:hypothetical protein